MYPTLGYLLGIVSVLGMAILPRAKFVQTMILNILSVCVGTAFGMLEGYSAVSARLHTPSSPPEGTSQVGYNSSASVVCAIWLFFQIYCINTFRAKFPQFAFPCIIYSIFVNVTSAYAPMFPTVAYAISFEKTLMEVFLIGLAIATGVSLLILPNTTRKIVFKQFAGYMEALRAVLRAEIAYFRSLEDAETFSKTLQDASGDECVGTPQATAVKAAIAQLQVIHGKTRADLPFAKREVAIGKLGAGDLKDMFEMNRHVFLPMIGLSAMIDVFERLTELNSLNDIAPIGGWQEPLEDVRRLTIMDWVEYMRDLHDNFTDFATVIDEGLEHVSLVLELKRPQKNKMKKDASSVDENDVEDRAEDTRPGSKGFSDYMETKISEFHSGKETALRLWAEHKGMNLPSDFFEHPATATFDLFTGHADETANEHQRKQRQLYMLLYVSRVPLEAGVG